MPRKWIAALLPSLAAESEPEVAARVLKAAAAAHFEHLGMAERVAPFRGNLDGFLTWLSKEWGWRIEYDRTARVLEVDEAKSYCVCPLVQKDAQADLGILCNCSEGFAERLFSAVVGHPVRAEVTQSVLRGAGSCRYRISLV